MTGYSFPDFDRGYSIVPNVLTAPECDCILSALSRLQRGRAGVRHLMRNSAVATLAMDHRLLEIGRPLLGAAAVPFRATLFEKSGKANWLVAWHQDTALPLASHFDAAGWGPWSEKAGVIYAHAPAWALSRILALRIHLDPSTNENGPLRVIAGSHTAGVLSDAQAIEYAKSQSSTDCPVPRGGVLVMRPLILHASSKARVENPRRVLHIEYADTLDLAHGIRLAIA